MSKTAGNARFPTTKWTLISRLKSPDAGTARVALEELCHDYRFPLYCVIRRGGLAHHDAEDALHDFLAKLLRSNAFAEADAEKGRLRAFLGTALQRFLHNWRRDKARRPEVLDLDVGGFEVEQRYQAERFHDHETPERLFDRQWARELLTHVLEKLGAQYAGKDKSRIFDALQPVLLRSGDLRQEDTDSLAAAIGQTVATLRVTYHRFLKDYRALLEAEVFQTVAVRDDIPDEISHLLASFRKV